MISRSHRLAGIRPLLEFVSEVSRRPGYCRKTLDRMHETGVLRKIHFSKRRVCYLLSDVERCGGDHEDAGFIRIGKSAPHSAPFFSRKRF